MAKTNSFNKREIEKNKQQKRKEKQMRREARKSQSPDSFEDMIAYVDKNGVITDTPPEVNDKQVIDPEEIEISVPQKEKDDTKPEMTGRVEYFDETRGFGFIKERSSVNKFFFHKSNAPLDIRENDIVTFQLIRGLKGMNAIDIKIVN